MSKTNVGLIQINNSFENASYFPYSVGLLAAFFKKHSQRAEEFRFLEPIFSRISIDEATNLMAEAEIVAFSVYGWNFRLSLEIAKSLKKNNQSILIIFGGPQVPDRAEQFLRENDFVDIACHGEGEELFLNILESFKSKRWDDIPSISYLNKGVFYTKPKRKRIDNLSLIPSPYLEGIFDQLIESHPEKKWLGLWETNRGCPFSCAYCDWGSATQQRLYQFDQVRLEREIQWFADKKIEFIFCCDSNFGIFHRDVDLVEYVVKIKEKYGYPQALSVQNTKNATDRSYSIQKTLSSAGLNKGVTLALQSTDKYTLKQIGRQNISLKSFEELQRRFNRDGVETYTDLILALPGETYKSFTNGVNTIIENGQYNRIQFINLSILPNAKMGDPLYQQKYDMKIIRTKIINIHGSLAGSEDRIEEIQDLVVGTNSLSTEDWVRLRVFSWITSFLFFDKLLQIPLILMNRISGFPYNEMIEYFLNADAEKFPIIREIVEFFCAEARNIQNGGLEFCVSADWLNIYWPHDEYIFIKLTVDGKMEGFYSESEKLLLDLCLSNKTTEYAYLPEAIELNKKMVKMPFQKEDFNISVNYNIWESYQSIIRTGNCSLIGGGHQYHVDCQKEFWDSWDDWFREVVWYGNKKGAYLYDVKEATVS